MARTGSRHRYHINNMPKYNRKLRVKHRYHINHMRSARGLPWRPYPSFFAFSLSLLAFLLSFPPYFLYLEPFWTRRPTHPYSYASARVSLLCGVSVFLLPWLVRLGGVIKALGSEVTKSKLWEGIIPILQDSPSHNNGKVGEFRQQLRGQFICYTSLIFHRPAIQSSSYPVSKIVT